MTQQLEKAALAKRSVHAVFNSHTLANDVIRLAQGMSHGQPISFAKARPKLGGHAHFVGDVLRHSAYGAMQGAIIITRRQ